MAVLHLSLLSTVTVLLLLSFGQDVISTVTITVDSEADNSNCLSAQQLQSLNSSDNSTSVCRTINDAMGNVSCDYFCNSTVENRLENVLILLADGVHRLSGDFR